MANLIIACVVCGLASLVLGFIWYHPKVFGTAWMKEAGLSEEDLKKGKIPIIFGITFLASAYLAYEMKWVNHPDENLPGFVHGMFHGFKNVGVFAVGAILIQGLFERRGIKYILINCFYWAVTFAVIGAILASFPSFKPKETTEGEGESESSSRLEQAAPQPFAVHETAVFRFEDAPA